jgi:malate permease and related proteins
MIVNFFYSSFNAVLGIVLLYLCAMYMRHKGFVKEEHSLVLAKLVTELCLPAMIFITVANSKFEINQLEPAFVMLGLEVGCVALAWWVSLLLKLTPSQKGAVVLCSAFGSSTFLGYSFIMEVFPGNSEALQEAVLISEVGVGYPIFIIAPILAAKFGSNEPSHKEQWKVALSFLKSPVFFALIVGILWSVFNLPKEDNKFASPFFQLFKTLSGALTPLAILSIGLMFKIPKLKSIIIPLIVIVSIKLILKPISANFISIGLGFSQLWREILVILAAMPSAVLAVVFIRRYGSNEDASLASAVVVVVTIISVITLTGIALIIG